MNNAPSPHIIIDINRCFQDLKNETRCDFLFIGYDGNDYWTVPLELKKGSPNATEITKQLQSGSEFAQHKIPSKYITKFVPIGVYGKRLHKYQINKLKKNRISFRDRKYEIKLIGCGTPLNKALP